MVFNLLPEAEKNDREIPHIKRLRNLVLSKYEV